MAAQKKHRGIRIPENVKEFTKMNFKEFKKENKEYHSSKKKLKKLYFYDMLYLLSDTIDFLLRYKHIQSEEIQKIKSRAYSQLAGKDDSTDFIKFITKVVKEEGIESVENIEYFPIILSEIITDINKANASAKSADPEAAQFDATEFYELNYLILKKKLKKAAKKGIDEDVALDVLCVIPTNDAMKYSKYFRAKSVLEILYSHAAKKNIDFKKIVKLLIDKEYYDIFISYALQERKEKVQKFNEKQKSFFNDVTTWVFEELEDMDSSTIRSILENYIKTRRQDDMAGKDGNRRYFLSSLPEDDFPNICKIVEQLKNKNSENEKYL